jgi:ATP-dependent Clp protease ATP-binding subunit ClpC
LTHGREDVTISDAEAVAQRMIGMPLGVDERIDALRGELRNRGLLSEMETEALLNRLSVTMRGLDLRASRPNAVILLTADAAKRADDLSRVIAGALLGSENRIVSIDFSRFTQPSDITMLVGAAPGYVGYSDSLPIDRVAQMPWTVLLCENVELSDVSVSQVMGQALADGFITQSDGKRVYLSDTVVLLTVSSEVSERRAIGFHTTDAVESIREAVALFLPSQLMDQVDLVCAGTIDQQSDRIRQVEDSTLADLARRYRKYGLDVQYDPTVLAWLLTSSPDANVQDWERLIDEHISPALIPYIAHEDVTERVLLITCDDGTIRVAHQFEPKGGKQ